MLSSPVAITNPAVPPGFKWWRKWSIHMVFAFRGESGSFAAPTVSRGSLSGTRSAPHPPSLFDPSLNGGFARM